MTFLEAAFEVLRREGRPLHFKDLTRLALKYDLLSVVGRDPEEMMQSRLQAEARRPSTELVRISPGVFGLRNMPSRAGKSRPAEEGTATTEEKVDEKTAAKSNDSGSSTATAAESGSSRRRRGGASKGSPHRSAAASEAPVSADSLTEAIAQSVDVAAKSAATSAAPPARDSHRRSGRRSRDEQRTANAGSARAAETTSAIPPTPTEPGTVPVETAAKPAAIELPVMAPAAAKPATSSEPATEPVATAARTKETPAAPPEAAPSRATPIPRDPVVPAATAPAVSAAEAAPVPSATIAPVSTAISASAAVAAPTPAPSSQSPRPAAPPSGNTPTPASTERPAQAGAASGGAPRGEPGGPRQMTLADAAYDVLRGSSDGRPLATRQIAEIALKRRLVRGELNDISRALRGALVREQRQRDSDGLRPRMRNAGPGQYALGERKLEPELYTAERDLMDRLSRTREATRVALRRRLRGMPAGPFELLMRLVLERMGMTSPELIKRGDGVAYFGGTLTRGSRQVRLLVAIRPGEGEIQRESIGELRAGIRMRGFDEGLMLACARLSAAAMTEANALPGIDVYDQDALTELLVRHQIGVRRMLLPIEYLDSELFNELTDAS